MRITTSEIKSLPRLAWLVDVDIERNEAALLHGKWVEVHDGFFVEGVWDAPFNEGAFHSTDNFFGSGGLVVDKKIIFVSSISTTDYLYYGHVASHVIVSNSLAFLLSYTDDELDPGEHSYANSCDSIAHGIDEYNPDVPTRSGLVKRLIFRNIVLDNGHILLEDKPLCKPFSGYDNYIGCLQKIYENIALNARDINRKNPLKILSTQSKGYDSTAVNSVAAKFGIDLAFTVSQSKGDGVFAERDASFQGDDDGSEIARHLGFDCVAIDRRQFLGSLDDEYLYFAGITNCEDLNFSGITSYINNPSLLLTGTLGEIYYSESNYKDRFQGIPIGSELRRGDLGGGHGLTEVRLNTGFIQLPLIYIGAQQRKSITDITDSTEMDEWRLNNSYDRPIPRRIAEEAGVPREMFGQKKMASTVSYSRPNIPQGSVLREEFFSFLVINKVLMAWQVSLFFWVHYYNSLLWFSSPGRHKWIYYLSKVKLKITGSGLRMIWSNIDSSLYCFSVNKRARDYKKLLK